MDELRSGRDTDRAAVLKGGLVVGLYKELDWWSIKCGEEIYNVFGDGTAVCGECGFRFGVVECEEES